MTSTARVEANQKNAQKSTGPRTLAGKERSRMNGLKHGLRAEQVVLPGESKEEFDAELKAFFDDWKPRSHTRAVLVERAWNDYWWNQGFAAAEGVREAKDVQGDSFGLIKAFAIEFDFPVTHPGVFAVHLWIERIGRTSNTAGFRVCSPDGATTHAHGTRTLVCLDPKTLRPTEWSEQGRAASRQLLRPSD